MLFRIIDNRFQHPNNSSAALFTTRLMNADGTYSRSGFGIFPAQWDELIGGICDLTSGDGAFAGCVLKELQICVFEEPRSRRTGR